MTIIQQYRVFAMCACALIFCLLHAVSDAVYVAPMSATAIAAASRTNLCPVMAQINAGAPLNRALSGSTITAAIHYGTPPFAMVIDNSTGLPTGGFYYQLQQEISRRGGFTFQVRCYYCSLELSFSLELSPSSLLTSLLLPTSCARYPSLHTIHAPLDISMRTCPTVWSPWAPRNACNTIYPISIFTRITGTPTPRAGGLWGSATPNNWWTRR